MYLKTSNKKQLAAAVTLAVMGMAWVAVPSQVWANGGDATTPLQYSAYTNQAGAGGALEDSPGSESPVERAKADRRRLFFPRAEHCKGGAATWQKPVHG